MQRIKKILSVTFVAIMLFLNIGLAVGFGGKLHAHFLGDNQILIHFHNMGSNGDHTQGHSQDFGGRCGFNGISSIITFINSAQTYKVNDTLLISQYKYHEGLTKVIYNVNLFYKSLRAPPYIS